MSERFIKFIDSEESQYLQENHLNAFSLLCLIAKRARRISGNPDGLEIGECFIGDYRKAGIETRKKYRVALNILVQRNHIEIIETCRTRKPRKSIKNFDINHIMSVLSDENSEKKGVQNGEKKCKKRATEKATIGT